MLGVAALTLLFSPLRAADSDWPAATRDQKPWTRWWWLGSAVDKENLTRELETIAANGFGGVEITPIYGAKGYESRYLTFLSPQYNEMLAYTCSEARRLGLGVDMATGTGWPFGGPQVKRDDAEQKVEIKDGELKTKATKFRVKRAAPGGEGWVLNPFSPAAMTRYLAPFSAAIEGLPAGALRGQFHDSFEYTANWSNEVEDRFLQMHRYQLKDYVDALSGKGDPEVGARVRYDYRETMAQLHLDYVRTWVSWAHSHGEIARNQAHGAPANLLDLYALADIPETEVFGASPFPIPGYRYDADELSPNRPQPLVNRLASSAAHVAGRRLASSETFTWLREHFHEAPSEMKPELDQLFLTGINAIFYHGTAYSPVDVSWPGWLFYASTQANPRNSLWRDLGDVNAYIARCQSLLQAGQPDNDFLVYWPIHDLWQTNEGWTRTFSMHDRDWLTETPTGDAARQLLAAGYSFDFVSDDQILHTTVLEKLLQAPGTRYRALILPPTKLIPPETLERLIALARQGATILCIGELPSDVPGYARLEARRQALQSLERSLVWKDRDGIREAHVGRGRLLCSGTLQALLPSGGAKPEPAVAAGLGVLRRSFNGAAVYFLANLGEKPIDQWVGFSRTGKTALLLDPRTGQTGRPASRTTETGTEIYLQLNPGESIFVSLRPNAPTKEPADWAYRTVAGSPVALGGDWRVSFVSGGPDLPSGFVTKELRSWALEGAVAERFAGTAAYETEFELPEGASAQDWLLDLGDVRETARVWVNGKEIDHVWSLPFRVRIGTALLPGKNTLRLEVTNLSANRIRDLDIRGVPWKAFHEINFVNAHYRPLDASKWPVQPSGLLGPVQLIPLKPLVP